MLAARLSEDPSARVLLLEAGGWDRDPMIHIPLGWGKILKERRHDWSYFCEPEPNVDGRAVECARGRVIGGSSSTNAMAFVRGNPDDCDRWAAGGLEGWSFEEVLPWFRRTEDWEDRENACRGAGGPLRTQFCRYADGLVKALAEAGREAGYPWTDDYNGAEQEGFGRLQMTIRKGLRSSTATAHLRPALKRSNLVVETGALATRIELGGTRATGVAYTREGPRTAVARREVILAGGVIKSPQLLMLAGIGAPEELARHGLGVRIPRAGVGKNLCDHVSVALMFHRKSPGPFFRMMRADRIMLDFVRTSSGGKGFSGDVPGGIVAFLKSPPEHPLLDLQLLFSAAPLAAWPYFSPFKAPFRDGFAMRVVAVQPQSRGHVALASAEPDAAPRIHQNFSSAEADWRSLRAGFGIARSLAASPAMAGYIEREFFPGPYYDDAGAIDAHIRKTSITVHHPAGTCRMGGEGDPGS